MIMDDLRIFQITETRKMNGDAVRKRGIGCVLFLIVFMAGCDPCMNNPCNNGVACDGLETCVADGGQAVCADGTAVVCDFPEFCTEPDGACVDPCDSAECSDDNDCTTDTCTTNEDETTTCTNDPTCDDEDECTVDDTCDDEGVCAGNPIECSEGNMCSEGSCVIDPCFLVECSSGEICSGGSCVIDLCFEVTCGEGGSCDTETGECINESPVAIDVLQLGDFYYPTGLFNCSASEDPEGATEFCPSGSGCDSSHWHGSLIAAIASSSGAANPSQNVINDPDSCHCGHGKVGDVARTSITVEPSELADYLGATNLSGLPAAADCP